MGVLIAQLGTPDAPTPEALRPYLKQFLWDPRIIEGNRLVWWFILNFIVLTTRPKRSARLYKRIWKPEGSPLMIFTKNQAAELQKRLKEIAHVAFGMRYGKPSLESAIDQLMDAGCTRILVFPMYPQYSATTTGSTYDAIFAHLQKKRFVPTIRIAEPYYKNSHYINALAATIHESWDNLGWKPDRLVLSYHGIPEKYVKRGDPYCCQCTETTEALLKVLKIPANQVIHTFQSRFGRDPWLRPYTDKVLESLPGEGIKNIAVAAPGFTADCLETLDELGNEGQEQFKHKGGEKYHLIPCLNDHPAWISAMTSIIRDELAGWSSGENKMNLDCKISCPLIAAGGDA